MFNSKRFVRASILMIALIMLSGCATSQPEEIVIVLPGLPISCGQDAVFNAVGYDKDKIIVPIEENLIWTSTPDSGVTIDANQTGQSAVIAFSGPGTYTIRAATVKIAKNVSIDVVCRELARIEVLPTSLDLKLSDSEELTVKGYDQFDDLIALTGSITWSVTGNIGTVDSASGPDTTFTATATGVGTVRADVDGFSDSSSAEVKPASVLTTILISPQIGTALVGKCTLLTAKPFDQYGDEMIPNAIPIWSVGGGIGTVSPASGWSTTFCATTAGSGEISITNGPVTAVMQIKVLSCG